MAVKKMLISESPNHLIIALSRFSYDYRKNIHTKIFKNIRYPETLEVSISPEEGKRSVQVYRLYSVIIHSGLSAQSGHYYAYARSSQLASNRNNSGAWYQFNDSSVGPSSYESFSRISESLSKDVPYLLYYVKEGLEDFSHEDTLEELKREVETDNSKYIEEAKQKKIKQKQQAIFNHYIPKWGGDNYGEDPDAEGGGFSSGPSSIGGPPIIF